MKKLYALHPPTPAPSDYEEIEDSESSSGSGSGSESGSESGTGSGSGSEEDWVKIILCVYHEKQSIQIPWSTKILIQCWFNVYKNICIGHWQRTWGSIDSILKVQHWINAVIINIQY